MPVTTSARLRRAAAMAAVGLLIMASALTGTGTAPADPAEPAGPLGYTCEFPAGPQQVSAQVTAAVPERGTPGKPIQPDQVAVTVTLAPEALAGLRTMGATTIAGKLTLTVTVMQNEDSVEVDWSGLDLPATPIPAEGELAATASGAVGAVTVTEPGDVTIVAGKLGIELVATTAEGGPTDPAGWSVSCAPNPDQDATLATVSVPEVGTPTSTRTPLKPSGAPGTPNGGPITIEPAPDAATPGVNAEIPPECRGDFPPFGIPPIVGCAFLTGHATVKKLNGSVEVPAALSNIAIGAIRLIEPRTPSKPAKFGQVSVGEIAVPKNKLPPLNGSFLAFGFVPITATMELSTIEIPAAELPPLPKPPPPIPPLEWRSAHVGIPGETQGSGNPCQPGQEPGNTPGTTCTKYSIRPTARASARVFDVKVNGVPLDVGKDCRTERPIEITLTGRTPEYFDIRLGGPLRGEVEIPPFTGCEITRTKEDLDPLLTGMVSGKGNQVRLFQGTICDPANPRFTFCPPTRVDPPPPTGSP